MARRRWKAGQRETPETTPFLRRFRKPIAIAAAFVVAIAFFIYRFNNSKYQYGDARSDYDRALAACLKDRTRVSSGADVDDDAAEACVRDTPSPAGAEPQNHPQRQ